MIPTPAFTPGPWTVHKSRGLNAYELRAGEAYLADIWGADTPLANGVARGAVKPNAHLIAAAPELYEALKECSFRLATLVAASGDFSDANARALDQSTAALQKADGK